MIAASPAGPFPYRLRIEHEGQLSLRLERPGGTLRFDPCGPVDDGDVVVLTWAWPEHLMAAADALAAGRRPLVVAPAPVRAWLAARGAPASCLPEGPVEVGGLRIQQWPYTPIPWVTPPEAIHKLRSAVLRPDRAFRRLRTRAGLPRSAPQISRVDLPDGAHLLHLNLALHGGTDPGWLAEVATRHGGARWLLLGCDFHEDQAVFEQVARFSAAQVLLVDLLGDVRRELGMPTGLLTPLCDRLRDAGVDAYVLASRVSYRFEHAAP